MVNSSNFVEIVLRAMHFGSFHAFRDRASLGIFLEEYLVFAISYVQ